MIMHVCDICNVEIDSTYCKEHPDATVSSIYVHDSDYYRDEETLREWHDLPKEDNQYGKV